LKTRLPVRRSSQSAYLKSNNPEGKLRLFFALWPPLTAAKALHDWAAQAHLKTGGRLTAADTIHLTLAFLGDVPGDRVGTLIDCARRVRGKPFDLRLDEGRWWAHNNIVWAGPRSLPEPLRDLAAQLDSMLKAGGFRTEKREFKAHISLVRRASGGETLPALEPVEWHAEEFVLVRSSLAAAGPAYVTLSRFSLAAERST
jgi:RNA 2',3'-cyclic 3'-phosphodiesterase